MKVAPCGASGDGRATDASRITTLPAGVTLSVQFRETIDHPGHFRIAFDDDGQDAFEDPTSYEDIQATPGLPVLADGIIEPTSGSDYIVEVTLPDIECSRCTLQLIQVMTDRAPYGDGNDLYYQCADLVLVAESGAGGSGGLGESSGGATDGMSTGGAEAGAGTRGVPATAPTGGTDAGVGEAT